MNNNNLCTTVQVLGTLLANKPCNGITNCHPGESETSTNQPAIIELTKVLAGSKTGQPKNYTKKTHKKATTSIPSDNNVTILGDSMIKHVQGFRMRNRVGSNVEFRPFPGAKTIDFLDYAKPTIRHKPKAVIIHAGTNDIKDKSAREVAEQLVDVAQSIANDLPDSKIALSQIIKRKDQPDLNSKNAEVNKTMTTFCTQRSWGFISHENIDEKHLNNSGLHLNKKGTGLLASNFMSYLTSV